MPVTIILAQNAYRVLVGENAASKPFTIDMSLQRHAYRNLEQAHAKPQNSILHNVVTDEMIRADLQQLGDQLFNRLMNIGQPKAAFRPTLAQQLAGVYSQRVAGQVVRASVNEMQDRMHQTLFGDYVVNSGRTYRVDNPSINFMNEANHCYPIAGPQLWTNVDQASFAGAVAFRRLELFLESKRQQAAQVWQSIERTPAAFGTPAYSAFTGARTNFFSLGQDIRKTIFEVAGGGSVAIDIMRFFSTK